MESPQFETLMQSLSPILQNLEQKRKELKSKGHSTGMWAGSIAFVLGIVSSLFLGLLGIFLAVGAAVLLYFICVNRKSKELSAYYKKDLVTQILQSFCENATFSPEQGIDQSVFQSCGLFISPNRYHTEDLIRGCVGKTGFHCAEVHAEEKRVTTNSKGGRREYWVDIFKGFLFIADFHKDFQGQTTVLRDSLFKFDFGGSRVKLENAAFEKIFDVHATDPVEARYLLTPSMMERLVALDRQFNGGITASFRNSTILIAIPETKNHFEASIWKSFKDISRFEDDFSAIRMLISIVEDLNLNTRIWSKE